MLIKLMISLSCISIGAAQKKPGGTGQSINKADLLTLKNAVTALVESQTTLNEYLKGELASIRDEVSNLRDDVSNLRDGMSNLRDGESNVRDNVLEIKEDIIELKKQFEEACDSKVSLIGKYGEVSVSPGVTCLDIQKRRLPEILPSGVYWVTLGNPGAQQMYCDMETDGGGWTLVWVYTFTDYANFRDRSNAVTPRPSWDDTGYTAANTPVSTTPPLSDTQLGALEFAKWKRIGNEFMIKSDINQWIACTPNIGSFVDWKSGSLNCRMVKAVATKCTSVVPNKIVFVTARGPALVASSHFYYFDTHTISSYPTHDPCGGNAENHIKDVVNPRGNVLLR